ncbi:MAG: hypothetical protein EPO35_01120 [Acidobacteria bacterium]|nr:MAG: hypothetical protein EPO35_01120 [Acidobacteriota bacterium]
MKILFLGKADDPHNDRAVGFCRAHFPSVSVHLGRRGDPLPAEALDWRGDCIVSYLSRWIVPGEMLDRAALAINFHPAPPQYPGTGCTNFALYDGATEYGVTCHHMAQAVDSGQIIAVRRFPIRSDDTVASLLARTYEVQLALFEEIFAMLARGEALPLSGDAWAPNARTRRELDALARISPDMSAAEVARRVRATTFGSWKPTVTLHGFTFELKDHA